MGEFLCSDDTRKRKMEKALRTDLLGIPKVSMISSIKANCLYVIRICIWFFNSVLLWLSMDPLGAVSPNLWPLSPGDRIRLWEPCLPGTWMRDPQGLLLESKNAQLPRMELKCLCQHVSSTWGPPLIIFLLVSLGASSVLSGKIRRQGDLMHACTHRPGQKIALLHSKRKRPP